MINDITFFMLAIPAVLFAGISKGGFGSGAAFAATPLLALTLTATQALGLMLPLLILMDLGSLRPYWKLWNARCARVVIVGAIPGIFIGAVFVNAIDADTIRLFIGIMALSFVVFRLLVGRVLVALGTHQMSDSWGVLAGVVTGFTSFVSHAGGPPASIYLLSKRLQKTEFQATTVIVFWAINLMKSVPYGLTGIFTTEVLLADLYLAPFGLIGVVVGVKFHRVVPEKVFFAITYVVLTLTGIKFVVDGIGFA